MKSTGAKRGDQDVSYHLNPEVQKLVDQKTELEDQVQALKKERADLRGRIDQDGSFHRLSPFFLEKPYKILRDLVHKSIPLRKQEDDLIKTPEFLRLQRIKQLGFIFYIWPGAQHTRFEHSLGVFHLARHALIGLFQRGENGGLAPLAEEDTNTFLAAALLHDVGHYPYSHAIEELGETAPYRIRPHEDVGRDIILNSSITEVLRDDWGIDPERVAGLITGSREQLSSLDRLFYDLLSGALDVDKLDYLVRDGLHCNVPYGGVDVARLLESLWVERNEEDLSLAITHKGVAPLHSLIWAKQGMFRNVYWHHTNRLATMMFLRAVQDLLHEGKIRAEDLVRRDDYDVITLLQEKASPDSSAKDLIDRLWCRCLYKRAISIPYTPETDWLYSKLDGLSYDHKRRREIEWELCKTMGRRLGMKFKGHEILIDIPKREGYEVAIQVRFEDPSHCIGPYGFGDLVDWGDVSGLTHDDMAKAGRYTRVIRVIAKDEDLARELRTDRHLQAVLAVLKGTTDVAGVGRVD